ncbi:MAG TPA: hypothetical protein VES42_08560 [Pilimelia sp.]|nr:hypothetical protein [Pilimelia sp.]
MPPPTLSPRLVFDPHATVPPTAAVGGGWRALPQALLGFYRDRLSWVVLGVTSVMLCYVGGLIMFWFHAVELGEGGPAISWQAHWLLDSTFAFIALTPALALIIPLAVAWSRVVATSSHRHVMQWAYAIIAGGLFALATTPGPLAHDMLVGRGTWIADRLTQWIGDPGAPLAPVTDYPMSAALTQQLGAGVALYVAMALVTTLMIRGLVGRSNRNTPIRETSPLRSGPIAGGA